MSRNNLNWTMINKYCLHHDDRSTKPVSGDEICPVCSKSKSKHNLKEMPDCSKQLVKMGLMRYCGIFGLTNKVIKKALGRF